MLSGSESGTESITQQQFSCSTLATILVSWFRLGFALVPGQDAYIAAGHDTQLISTPLTITLPITTSLISRKYIGNDKEPLDTIYLFSASIEFLNTSDQGLTASRLDLSTIKMLNSLLTLVLAATAIASPLVTSDVSTGAVPPPDQVTIKNLVYGGTGCPQGSVGSFVSPERQTSVFLTLKP